MSTTTTPPAKGAHPQTVFVPPEPGYFGTAPTAPTPETDAFIGDQNEGLMTEGELAMCEFARMMERSRNEERDKARAERERLDKVAKRADQIRNALVTAEAENVLMRDAIKEAQKAITQLQIIAEHGIPTRAHKGSCGPWSSCDEGCAAAAYCSEYLHHAKQTLAKLQPYTTP